MENGRYGIHGGQYIPETLMNEILRLEKAYEVYKNDPDFISELNTLLKEYAGRPSLLYYAEKMTEDLGGAKVYLKREDLNHTGSHKINNVLGQVLLAKRMGKTRVIAETGAGQHGVATATAAALMGMECEIFMGKEDTDRQALNVYRMELLGAKVHPVASGTMTLKDAVNETMREWVSRVEDTHYVLGSVMGKRGQAPRSSLSLRRRRKQRHGNVLQLHPRRLRPAHRLRSRRPGHPYRPARRHHRHRDVRRLPRDEILFLPGRPGADRTGLLHFRRS